jgi:PAS domain S-box-containing protein
VAKILIVDDYAGNRHLMETILRSRGYATAVAPNGSEALKLAADQEFDLVLSDILMPVMDGFELCRAWKQDPRLARVPFAFCTATYTAPMDEAFGLSLGADRYLQKPVAPDRLLQEVGDLLGRQPVPPGQVDENGFFREHKQALFRKLENKLEDNDRLGAKLARYGRILAASHNDILVFSGVDLTFTFGNQEVLDHLGLQETELLRLTPLELVAGLTREGLDELLQPLRQGTRERTLVEFELLGKDGRRHPVAGSLEPILDGDELSFLAVVLDITERRRQEAETRRLEAEINHVQKLESLGRMAASVAHDLNNMLAPIMGMAELLQERYGDEPELRRKLATIALAAERGRQMVGGLTDFARRETPVQDPVDLNALVRQNADLLRPSAAAGIRWELDLAGGLPRVQGDAAALGRVLLNLGRNALDAMNGEGVLRFTTRSGPFRWVEVAVADTGTGIPDELLAQVMEPFFTTKPRGKGTGLGLSIVNSIVRSHGGTLTLESQEGRGTTVRIQLPTARDLERGANLLFQ